jgi:HD superfamily phosphohydrolase
MSRVTFYDPLYDFVSFEEAERERQRGIFDAGFSTAPVTSVSKSLLGFLKTPEVNRLSFLRQSDLSFLVYPSATHTRFAHAVGCCYLGYVAAREITVTVRGSEERHLYLSKWLEERGWKEEFLLALLLHDIGHFAFSHALENNADLWIALQGKVDHEDVACQMIRGSGEFVDSFYRRHPDWKEYKSISQVTKESLEIDADVIAFLVSGTEEIIAQRDIQARTGLQMLHELTSGLLDLDRIDHYRRDSYFSGIKFASNLNFASLLNGFSIGYQTDAVDGRHEVRLSRDAIGHALTLLHAKERLVHDCFENVANLAYEVMLHQAFNYFCFGDEFYTSTTRATDDWEMRKQYVFELLMATDEELLLEMTKSGTEKVKGIVSRIRNRLPYACIGRRVSKQRNPLGIAELREGVARKANVVADSVVIRLGKKYGEPRGKRSSEWLHLDALNDENGRPLETHEEYQKQIEHFKRVQDDGSNLFWVFTPSQDEEVIRQIGVAVEEIMR